MGNANSGASGSSTSQRDRHKSGDSNPPLSPGVKDGQAFTFEKRNSLSTPGSGGRNQKIILQNSHEDDEPPNFAKPTSSSMVSVSQYRAGTTWTLKQISYSGCFFLQGLPR